MMNKMRNKLLLLLGVVLIPFTGCEDITELNVDPNNPVEVPSAGLITQAEFSLYNALHGRGYNAEWTMLLVQHWANNEYAEADRFVVDGNDFDGTPWTTFYSGVLNELKVARDLIAEDENLTEAVRANQIAIIDILSMHAYQSMVDGYGDLPFSEALDGSQFPLPKYDSQQSIYMAMLERLDQAVASIDEGAGSFSSGELIYDGDMASWKKLGASLLMRMALRVVDVDQATAATYITKANDYGLLTGNADNGLFTFDSDPSLSNPLYRDNALNNRDDFSVCKTLVDAMKALGDTLRLANFANPTNSGTIEGMPPGLTDADAFALKPLTSRPNTEFTRSPQNSHVIVDYAEVQFMLAEAYQRGILGGDAAAAYEEGIRASMEYWSVDDQAHIDAYIAANPYDASDWKTSIGTQKWIAFYTNGPEAWAEWRRLDAPQLAVPAAAVTPNQQIPVRLPYPISEQSRNAANLGEVADNPNDLLTSLWWDVN